MQHSANKYILAIDHGTSGVKASLVSVYGKVISSEYERTPIYYLPRGGAEQDPAEWWHALVTASKRLMQKSAVPKHDVIAVCVSSTFSSTVAVDKGGAHLMNSITWMDSRGAPYVRNLMGGFPSVEGYNLFRILRWIPKTAGGPTLSGKDDIAHVLLIMHEYPEIYAKTRMFLPSKDYLNLRLTGEFAASYDSIQLFWVTDIRDVGNIRYDESLIRLLGIDRGKLPPLKKSTDILGTILPGVADEIGVSRDVRVIMGSPDHQCACIGSGAVRDFEGHIYIGTSSWVQCVIPFKKTDVFHSIASFPTAIPGKYQSVNEQDIAGGCLQFLVENILYHGNVLSKGAPPENIYEILDEIAAGIPAGSHGTIFTPWLNGERTPVDDITVRGGFFNLSKTTTRDDMVRAVLEGVAFNTRWSLGYVEKFVGRRMDPLNMVGGGAKSDVWCRIFADVLDRTIRQVKDPMQANARGAAFIAAVGLGFITFDDIPNLIEFNNTFSPDPAHRSRYDELFREFLAIYKNNRAMYRRLNRLQS
ncbi:MAG: FGGY-family carbohydrate kinase [Deltaproteobacteria bacterium]|nr:FGGY-family carbohydrate kinase [Deltaproteobacteria bacterium]